jgi:hypothetical protein
MPSSVVVHHSRCTFAVDDPVFVTRFEIDLLRCSRVEYDDPDPTEEILPREFFISKVKVAGMDILRRGK